MNKAEELRAIFNNYHSEQDRRRRATEGYNGIVQKLTGQAKHGLNSIRIKEKDYKDFGEVKEILVENGFKVGENIGGMTAISFDVN